jgi:hypothetical protein
MTDPSPGTRLAAALALLGLAFAPLARAQEPVPVAPSAPGLPSAAMPDPAAQPPAIAPESPGLTAPGPAASTADLSLPAAERSFGGGEAPTAIAEEEAAEAAEPTPLMGFLGLEDSPIKIYGWIQNSFTGNTNGNGTTRTNFGVTPNFQANEWMGNQYYLIFENPLEQEDEINFGFRIDNLFGNDWSFNYMQGLLNGVFAPPGSFAGYDPAQFYGEVHLPFITEGGLDVKVGRWYTLAGYEVVPAIGRPLLSVPYMFTFGQPFTHSGVLTTLHVNDRINLYNGAINGWDRFFNERYTWGYIGGFSWTSEDEKTSLAFTTVWGPNQYPRFLPANQQLYTTGYVNIPSLAGVDNPNYSKNDRTLFTTVLTHKWSDKLTQVIETDQGWELNVPGLASNIQDGVVQNGAAKSAQWQSFGNWFLYSFSDKLTGVWRSEVFWDQQGSRTGLTDGTRFVGDRFYEMTLGMIYKPCPWVWFRPEARYDWSQFRPAFTDGTRKEQFTLGFDVIVLF